MQLTKSQIWADFNRMQKACMAKDSLMTRKEFFAQSEQEQRRYYNWMCKQVGPLTVGRWTEDPAVRQAIEFADGRDWTV